MAPLKLALTWLSARRDLTIITMKRAITLPSIILIALLGLGAGCHAGTSGTRVAAASGHGKRHVPTASLNSKRPTGKNSGASRTGSATSAATERCRELLPLITRVASEFDIETSLLVGIVRVESNFRNDVKSPVGAVGLTQCMPATARAKRCGPLNDPYENLRCGARVIKAFLKYYKDSIYLGLSGYNAGHGMPGRARQNLELPQNVDYVEKVLQASARFEERGCDF